MLSVTCKYAKRRFAECRYAECRYTVIREYSRGKYHCSVDLLFDFIGLAFLANKNQNYQLSYS